MAETKRRRKKEKIKDKENKKLLIFLDPIDLDLTIPIGVERGSNQILNIFLKNNPNDTN